MRRQRGDCAGQGRLRLVALVAGLWLISADLSGQSLADVAAREAARRAAIVAPSHVYTDRPRADLDRLSSLEAPVRPQQPPPAIDIATALPLAPPVLTTAAVVAARAPAAASPRLAVLSAAPAVVPAIPEVGSAFIETGLSTPQTGWSPFRIKKTLAELAETARLQDAPEVAARARPSDVRLPPQHDALRVATGIGYLQGADFGGDVAASGRINGMQTEASGFFTAGVMGLQSRSARVSMIAPDGRWRGEGGDLFSDLRGLARGARVSWSPSPKWTPSLALYLRGNHPAANGTTVVGYRDRLQVLPRVRVGGEVTSDGALFFQTQYVQPKLDVTAFYRATRGPIAGHDKGISGGLAVGRGVAVSGAVRLSDAASDSSQWQLTSLRLPLPRQASVTLERTWWTGSADDGATNAVTLQVPLGPVRLMQRVQWGRTDYRQRAVPFGFDRRQSHSSASYTPGRWGQVQYQQSTQWFDDGTVQEWDEISSTLQLGRRTTAQLAAAFPQISDPQRLRARVTQRLSSSVELEAQYGRLSAFQMTRASTSEQSRVMVTLRKTWQIESPARGGEVRGRALDQAGGSVAGALVRLGPYSVITDETGDYAFTRVPDGRFELALDRNALPASYSLDEKPRPLTVTRGSREQIDLQVVPLNAIRGRVYLDRNRNGSWDEGEGIANAVVAVNGSVTATSATGAYAFYNLPPGRYTIRLDVQRLAKGLAPTSPVALDRELTPDAPLVGMDFVVEKKDKPIIMREARR